MKKAKSKKFNLRALNDLYIIKEDSIELTQDETSGLTKDVIGALKEKRLVLPDIGQYFAEKFPCRGVVLSMGPLCREDVKEGDRVVYARLGGQRSTVNGETLITIREGDVHAVIV
jgi:co-chaperonin GroES (HSP10)